MDFKTDKMKNEQKLETVTEVHLDFIDRIKVLFGRKIKVKVDVWIPTEVESYNGTSSVEIIKKSKSTFSKDKPDYGYSPIIDEK